MAEYPYNLIADIFGRNYVQRHSPDLLASIEYVIADLEPREQFVLHSYYRDGLTAKQIAEKIERSTQTVYNVIHKAIRRLRWRPRARCIEYGVSGLLAQNAYKLQKQLGRNPRSLPLEATTIGGKLYNTLKDAGISTAEQVVKLGSDYFKHVLNLDYYDLLDLYYMLINRGFIEEADQAAGK